MQIFPEDIPFLRRLNIPQIGAVITTLQKFIFILSVVVSVWHGSVYEWFSELMMPKQDSRWFFFSARSQTENCQGLPALFTRYHCIQSLLLNDKIEMRDSAMKLPLLQKFAYLVIRRSLHFAAPFVFQLSLLAIPLFTIGLLLFLVNKTRNIFGYDSLWNWVDPLTSRFQGNKVSRAVYLTFGILIASIAVCLSTTSRHELKSGCENLSCMYCFPRLMHTLFKEHVCDEYTKYEYGKSTRIMLTSATLLSTVQLTCLLYMSTVLFLSVALYIFIDAILSLKVFSSYISRNVSTSSIRSYWCKVFEALIRSREGEQEIPIG